MVLAPAAGARRVGRWEPVVPSVRGADCGHRPANFLSCLRHGGGGCAAGHCARRFCLSLLDRTPKKEQQPKPAELGGVADLIAGRMREGEAARMAERGPVALYQLSRDLCDLLR